MVFVKVSWHKQTRDVKSSIICREGRIRCRWGHRTDVILIMSWCNLCYISHHMRTSWSMMMILPFFSLIRHKYEPGDERMKDEAKSHPNMSEGIMKMIGWHFISEMSQMKVCTSFTSISYSVVSVKVLKCFPPLPDSPTSSVRWDDLTLCLVELWEHHISIVQQLYMHRGGG